MPENESRSVDLLGVKPIGDAVKLATTESFKGAAEFFGRICLPAAEEFGLLLRDRVGHWRAMQATKIAHLAQERIASSSRKSGFAHPRLVFQIIENGSWSDDDAIQHFWAGILASSCTDDGKDDSNVIFVSLLSQLTGVQVRILNHAIEISPKYASPSGLPFASQITLTLDELIEISGCNDTHRLDRELDHLRALDLIGAGDLFQGGGGFTSDDTLTARLRVTALALHLYVRGQGYVGSPTEYFTLMTMADTDRANSTPVTE